MLLVYKCIDIITIILDNVFLEVQYKDINVYNDYVDFSLKLLPVKGRRHIENISGGNAFNSEDVV